MKLSNISLAQRSALRELVLQFSDRPSPDEYAKGIRKLAAVPAPDPKGVKSIKGASSGVHGTARWSTRLFKPGTATSADIPEGLALESIWDSGGNHALVNAALCEWRRLWNSWYSPAGVERRKEFAS